MTLTIDGVTCEYEACLKSRGDTLVFLHGWGGDIRSFRGAYNSVKMLGMRVVNIAFPKNVPPDWGIYDYAVYIKNALAALGVEYPVIVGHSFGGRVALILASQKLCKKLVLVDAAGMKPRLSVKKKIKIARYRRSVRRGKPLDGAGSADYNNTDGDGRKVFVRIVNTHLDGLLAYIDCPTLIVWGKSDKDTPPYMARRLHRGIKGSSLEFMDGGHYSYIDSNYRFIELLTNFVTDN